MGNITFPRKNLNTATLLIQAKQTIYKFFFIENLQVFHAFAYAYVFYRYFKLIGYSKHYAAFCSAIQLGYSYCGHIGCRCKMFGLFYSVLASTAIQHHPCDILHGAVT